MNHQQLLSLAEQAREHSHALYSNFAVGAAVLAGSGKVYLGCNVENASYGATNCAERTALFSAIAAGEREFEAIAIIGGRRGEQGSFCPPCGICRQVMAEFLTSDTPVILGTPEDVKVYTLQQLLPLAFTQNDL